MSSHAKYSQPYCRNMETTTLTGRKTRAKKEKLTAANAGNYAEKQELSFIAGSNVE